MKHESRYLLIPVIALALAVTRCDCGDPVLPSAPSLIGDYTGIYIWATGSGDSRDSLVQAVTAQFTETTYSIRADTSAESYDPDVCFCRTSGTYVITDRVSLIPSDTARLPDNCPTCDTATIPVGSYTLEQPSGGLKFSRIWTENDVVIMSQLALLEVVPESTAVK